MNIPRMNVHRPKSHSGGMPAGPQPSGEVPVSEWTNQVGQFTWILLIRFSVFHPIFDKDPFGRNQAFQSVYQILR